MIRTITSLRELEEKRGEGAIVAAKLFQLHEFARTKKDGLFLELGTHRVQATKAIIEACRVHDGRLVSIDIMDCETAASGPECRFNIAV